MPGPPNPELSQYVGKRVRVTIKGERIVEGTVRGYDVFLNLVLEHCIEVRIQKDGTEERIQMGLSMIRGNNVQMIDALERIDDIVRKEEKSGGGRR